jgi:type VI protein secretion system component VasF
VESKFYRGDVLGAQKASKLAKQMVIWSVISWFIIAAIVVAFYVFTIVLSTTTGEWK